MILVFHRVREVILTGAPQRVLCAGHLIIVGSSVRGFHFVHTEFDDPVAIGYSFTGQTFQDSENVLISRFQLDF